MQFGGYEGIVDLESILKGYFILRAYLYNKIICIIKYVYVFFSFQPVIS